MRAAGTSAQLAAREGMYAVLRMRSGEMRKVLVKCRACIGEVSNAENNLRSFGKAGASRWCGRCPSSRCCYESGLIIRTVVVKVKHRVVVIL